jgi:hypothetical protein
MWTTPGQATDAAGRARPARPVRPLVVEPDPATQRFPVNAQVIGDPRDRRAPQEIARRRPRMFAHWRIIATVSAVLV